jgi:putative SOS response-associated peptidase YedK
VCNHYRNHTEKLQSWREYIAWDLRPPAEPYAEDVDPKRKGLVIRRDASETIADVMSWGIVREMRGNRPGTLVSNAVTSVRNLSSPFWKSTLASPVQRCLVPFTTFAEPTLEPLQETGKKGEIGLPCRRTL